MGVSLLLITHDDIGSSLLNTAINMMGVSPITYKNLIITSQMDIEQGYTQAIQLCSELDSNDDILIVTDMYGSTPSNVAAKLLENTSKQRRIILTGLNLPMLVKIMNYAHLDVSELAQKACSGATESIFIIEHPIDCH
ncbi:MAG: PTS fructose transporter subunit IIA [gamma proteobacterium symbiont of Bathyaustriella thionipta]|nr:PTS fructose transporter subunit IIA [gamma proteobacterium symbiont of Bathyaustriella thionipta]MCU7948441.1 PTS fructose transporter subunit IIA [gamma proteobacterium symbiont of Bathyaustriella thionipta]MCU7954140.1 PTS fructose transporter subunit IIA [gamma proteobacterium symbiont of Bathyaustriella thionipta]MCU7955991.1 PTS fructose transporter subunit IIA [gamma proteobacterium symbiont of Bathyaustriella thionipta]MCU7968162.1 PTS fructose transporter subunit IIA [gamma proteoba